MIDEFMALWQTVHGRAIFTFLVFVLMAKLVFYVLRTYIHKLTEKTATKVDDLILDKVSLPVSVLFFLYGAKLAVDSVNFANEAVLLQIFDTVAVINAAYIIVVALDIVIEHWMKDHMVRTMSNVDKTMIPLFNRTVNVIIFCLAGLLIFRLWGVEIAPFLAGMGIAGIAVAFALQNTLGNVIGGISLVLDKNFKVGDAIELNPSTPSALAGTVVDLSFRSTKVLSYDGEELIIPNSILASSVFKNVSHPTTNVRVVINFGVTYGSDIGKVKQIALKTIKTADLLVGEPAPLVLFTEMGDYALKFTAYFWISDYTTRALVKDDVLSRLYSSLTKAGIEIPYPTQTIHLMK